MTQWEYNEDLRQACHPPTPPAEQWRVDLHEQSASKVRTGPAPAAWGRCNTHVHHLSHKALAAPSHEPTAQMYVVGQANALALLSAGSQLSLPVRAQHAPLVLDSQHRDAWVIALQILGEPNTFRDAVTPEDEAHFERARAACLQMWQQLEALSSTQHCMRVMEQPAARHADGALSRPCQT